MNSKFNFKTLPSISGKVTEANILIHGYSAGHNANDKKELTDSIPDVVSHYTNIFAFWPASHFSHVNKTSRALIGATTRVHWSTAAVVLAGDRALHFLQIRSRAEDMGKQLFSQLNDYLRIHHPEITAINLIGHSLGGRLIVSSLKNLANTSHYSFTVNDVLLMAAAVKVEPSEAQQIRSRVSGRLINAYSKSDWALLMNIDETCLGRNEVEHFENIQIAEFGHGDYWKKLPEVLTCTQFKLPLQRSLLQKDVLDTTAQAVLPADSYAEHIMTFELNTPSEIYQRINEELSKVISSLTTTQSHDKSLKQEQSKAKELLQQHQKELQSQLVELERNAEWNTFTIAFYGETGAGKSTIIETLRILLQEPTKLASQKKFREIQSQCILSKEELQKIQHAIDQTEAKTADLIQQLAVIHEHHAQLHNDAINAINQTRKQNRELTQQLNVTFQQYKQQHNDAINALTQLQIIITERKRTASLWQKLLSLFRKSPEEAELSSINQQLPAITAKRDHAGAMLLDKLNVAKQSTASLEQKLPTIASERDNACAMLLVQQTEAERLKNSLIQQLQTSKSSLTELLSELEKQADGEIIGDGRSDFTRQNRRYDLQLDGQAFALLDVPGIEGSENLISNQVKQAVQTAHAVFYVTDKAAPPQTGDIKRKGTLEKIKEHLGPQTEVWTVFNKRVTNVKRLGLPALISNDELEGLTELDKIMHEQLGIHYRQVFPLTALPALLASTDHFVENSLNANRRNKMLTDFDAETLLEKSQLRAFLQLLNSQLLYGSHAKITRANFNKAGVALNLTTNTLNTAQETFTGLAEKLKLDGQSAQTQLTASFKSLVGRLESSGQQQIDIFASAVRNKIYALIENDVSNDCFKDGLKDSISIQQEQLSAQLTKAMEKDITQFQNDVEDILKRFEGQARDLADIYTRLHSAKLNDQFNLKLDLDNGLKVTNLLAVLAGGALLWWNPAGWFVLAMGAASIAVGIYKSVYGFFSADYKKAQQRKSVEDNLQHVTTQLHAALQTGLKEALPIMQEKIKQLEQALETPGKQSVKIAQLLRQSISQFRTISRHIDLAGKIS